MKEYRSRNSGRYVFNEDMHNLQELALSPAELFRDCGLNFVISGCAITVTQNNGVYTISVTDGYVWLNGKIRKVAAFSGTTNNISTIGIYAVVSVGPLITYFNGDSDNQYNDYSGAVQINYDNTGGTDFIAAVYSGGNYAFPNLRTAYFDHYCIMNNGTPGHVGSLLADEIDTAVLKINHVPVADIYVPKAGCTMNNGASLVFVNGSDSTTISGSSLTVGGTITGEDLSLLGDATVEGDITAASFIKDGGTSSQFLKADGSVDDTSYATASALADYLPLSGGTLTGNLKCNVNLAVDGNISVLGNIVVSTNLNVQGTISGVNETLTGNLNAADGTFTGDINAHDGTFTGELVADSAEITNGFTAGTITVNGIATIGGALTTQSTASIGGDTTVTGEVTATKFIKTGGTSAQFLKANGDVDSNTYATTQQLANSIGDYLPLSGGVLTGSVESTSFIKTGGTALQFLKADGSVDSTSYLSLAGGTLSGNLTAPSFIKSGGTSSQFLKADGSVDSNTYVTTSALNSYLSNLSDFFPADGGTIYSGDHYINLVGGGITIGHMEGQATLALTAIDRNLGISAKAVEIGCNTSVSGSITASSFIKSGGTSSQFLKADGSVDSNTYVTSSALSNYLSADGGTMYYGDYYLTLNGGGITLGHLEGQAKLYLTSIDRYLGIQAGRLDVNCNTIVNGSITATSLVKSGGTSSQFLKADGSVDNNTYATASSLSNYVTQSTLNSTLSGYAHSSDLNDYMSLDDGGTIYSGDHYVTIRGNGITIGHLEGSTTLSVTAIDRELGINNNVVVSGTVTATSFPTSSDERLKTKISDVLLTAEQIANAPAINFKYKDGDQSIHAGTIAQYWQEILPAVIMSKGNRLTMDYGPAAMVAVINLAKEVVALRQEINRLSN